MPGDREAVGRDKSIGQQVSPDKVAVSHAIGRGLFVEICHLLLVQLVHVHLHVCTKRKAVRGQSHVRGGWGAHQTAGICREGKSQLISASPGWHRAPTEASWSGARKVIEESQMSKQRDGREKGVESRMERRGGEGGTDRGEDRGGERQGCGVNGA